MERPQCEPTVRNPSAAVLMVANIQDTGSLAHWGTYNTSKSPSICYLQPFFSVVGKEGIRTSVTLDFAHVQLPCLRDSVRRRPKSSVSP